jgi:phosphoglycerate kinase
VFFSSGHDNSNKKRGVEVEKLRITDLEIENKRVLMRVDFNVPLTDQGRVGDPSRIMAVLPTIEYVLSKKGRLILMSHLGRPKGEKRSDLSLKPIAKFLSGVLNTPVKFCSDCHGEEALEMTENLQPREIMLLENLRFHRAEVHPDEDPTFAKKLSKLGDVYVNEAFGCAHRKHISTYSIAQYFPGKAALGFLMEKEVNFLTGLLEKPEHPFFAFVGGAKISSKIGVLRALLKHVDALVIGGAMAYTFFKAKGFAIGNSLVEDDYIETAQDLLYIAKQEGIPVHLPMDLKITQEVSSSSPYEVIEVNRGIPDGFEGVDIGPQTISFYTKLIQTAKTVLWNGPFGIFEIPPFSEGTMALAHALAKSHALSVVGGGDSLAAIHQAGVDKQITHLSTGGGATLEFIENGSLPGVDILSDRVLKKA